MFYQDPSTGLFVPVFGNIACLPYANAIPDSRTAGFSAEARGTSMQGTEIVDVSQSATGSSGQLPTRSTSSAGAGGREKPETLLVKPQRFDGRGSLDTFLLQFEQLPDYMRWGERERRYHLGASLEGPACLVLMVHGVAGDGFDVHRRHQASPIQVWFEAPSRKLSSDVESAPPQGG